MLRKYLVVIIIIFSFMFAFSAETDWAKIKSAAEKKKTELLYKSETSRKVAVPLLIIGPVLAGAGFGLFLHDKAFDGKNSPSAQYSLMFAGLSLIGTGVTFNYYSDYCQNRYQAYDNVTQKEFDPEMRVNAKDFFTQTENQARKLSVKTLKIHGTVLILLSLPIFALASFSIYEMVQYINEVCLFCDISHNAGFGGVLISYVAIHANQVLLFAPGLASLTGGIIMLAKASKYEKLNTEPSILTLNSIAPIIDPVSKTYGLALGFSF
jgi:hypothetical protein